MSDEDMTSEEFDALLEAGEQVELITAGLRVRIKGSPFVVTEPGTWASGNSTNLVYRP